MNSAKNKKICFDLYMFKYGKTNNITDAFICIGSYMINANDIIVDGEICLDAIYDYILNNKEKFFDKNKIAYNSLETFDTIYGVYKKGIRYDVFGLDAYFYIFASNVHYM